LGKLLIGQYGQERAQIARTSSLPCSAIAAAMAVGVRLRLGNVASHALSAGEILCTDTAAGAQHEGAL
jgi:hypothetical protein